MADFFDRFSGNAGPLSSHTADSGDTWIDPLATCSISGSGSVYTSGAVLEGKLAQLPPLEQKNNDFSRLR